MHCVLHCIVVKMLYYVVTSTAAISHLFPNVGSDFTMLVRLPSLLIHSLVTLVLFLYIYIYIYIVCLVLNVFFFLFYNWSILPLRIAASTVM